MLGVYSREEAKKVIRTNPAYKDVTFKRDAVLQDGEIIGHIGKIPSAECYFIPIEGQSWA